MTALSTVADLRAHYGEPMPIALDKEIDHLDRHSRRFIALSPFVMIGTSDADGACDVSPKGDPPGFVTVLDDRTLAIPDRPGNRRVDSMRNLAVNPGIGLIFLIPGIDETLRVKGTAEVRDDADLNAALAVNGRPALSAIVVAVKSAMIHCGKALMRSRLWGEEHKVPRSAVPTIGQMLRDQTGDSTLPTDQAAMVESYKRSLY
jgi:PPOX class probable FMN-dependent enzyme